MESANKVFIFPTHKMCRDHTHYKQVLCACMKTNRATRATSHCLQLIHGAFSNCFASTSKADNGNDTNQPSVCVPKLLAVIFVPLTHRLRHDYHTSRLWHTI